MKPFSKPHETQRGQINSTVTGWHREIKQSLQNCCGEDGRAQKLNISSGYTYPSLEAGS